MKNKNYLPDEARAALRQEKRWNAAWRRASGILGICAAILTIYALILPAITASVQTICGSEEHTHTEDCYQNIYDLSALESVCRKDLHVHTSACRNGDGDIVCGYEDYYLHTHSGSCRDGQGVWICALPEAKEHRHDENCYTQYRELVCGGECAAHQHTAECFTQEKGALTCQLEENHIHTDACLGPLQLSCGEQESQGHSHDGSCYESVLACGIEEFEEHAHSSECYGQNVICGQDETPGHAHGDSCYSQSVQCGQSEGHVHGDSCYAWNEVLACGLEDTPVHTDGCYETTTQLTCEKPEAIFHIHGSGCYNSDGVLVCGMRELRTHQHSEACFSAEALAAAVTGRKLVCGLEEHTHTDSCYPDGKAPAHGPMKAPGLMMAPALDLTQASGGEAEAPQAEEPSQYDIRSMITTVSMKVNGQSYDGNTPVNKNDQLEFKMEYTVPGSRLNGNNKTLTYTLPFDPGYAGQVTGGIVYSSDSQAVGTYSIQGTSVTVTFNDAYVTQNSTGTPINCTLTFSASAGEATGNTPGGSTIRFSDTVTIDVKVKEELTDHADLRVEKKADKKNEAGEVQYTIEVTSQGGTGGKPVKLNDSMTGGLKLENETFTIKDKDGNDVQGVTAPTAGSNNFQLELPAMAAGDKYTITYTAKRSEALNGTVNAKNTVKVESGDDEKKYTDKAEVTTKFERELVDKTGTGQDGVITWTVTINKSQVDLEGWTLDDPMLKNATEIKLTDSSGKEVTLQPSNFPYTFPNTSDTYVLTYQTTHEPELGGSLGSVNNRATLDKGPEKVWDDGYAQPYPNEWGNYNPYSKTTTSQSGTFAETSQILGWSVNLNANKGLKGTWYYEDTLQQPGNSNGEHYLTYDQAKAIQETVKTKFENVPNVTFTIKDADGNFVPLPENGDSNAKYYGFKIAGAEGAALPADDYSFTYASTAVVTDLTQGAYFANKGVLWSNNNYQENTPSVNHTPKEVKPVVKKRPTNNQTTQTFEKKENVELKWTIELTVPEDCKGEMTITEHLPEGTTLEGLKLGGTDFTKGEDGNYTISYTVNNVNDTITATKRDDGNYDIVIPATLTQALASAEQTIYFDLTLKPTQASLDVWQTKDETIQYHAYTNSLTVSWGDQTMTPGDSTITAEVDDHKQQVFKTGLATGRLIDYAVEINPEAEMLLSEDVKTLTVKDEIKQWKGGVELSLVQSSVKVVDVATGIALDKSEYQFMSKTVSDENESRYQINFTVPNGQHLKLVYQYRIVKYQGNGNYLINTAAIEGYANKGDEGTTRTDWKIEESGATADLKGITMYKEDAADAALRLPGAKFQLLKYNGTEYKLVSDAIVSDKDGKLNLPEEMETNTAYRLIETKAPNGYIPAAEPFDFLIVGTGGEKIPPDFSGERFTAGVDAIFPNTRNNTAIDVVKQWSGDGEKPNQISVDLYQKAVEGVFGEQGTVDVDKGVSLKLAPNNQTWTTINIKPRTTIKITFSTVTNDANANPMNTSVSGFYNGGGWESVQFTCNGPTQDAEGKYHWEYTYEFTITAASQFFPGLSGKQEDWTYKVEDVNASGGGEELANTYMGTYTVSAANGWKLHIGDLPLAGSIVDENGNVTNCVYYYSIKERPVPGWDCTVAVNNGGINNGAITITNTKNDVTPTGLNLLVEKKWKDTEGNDLTDIRYRSMRFQVLQNDVADWVKGEDGTLGPYIVDMSPSDGVWSVYLSGLPEKDANGKDYTYTVTELGFMEQDGNFIKLEDTVFNSQVNVTDEETSKTATIVNTRPDLEPTKLVVKKVFDGDDGSTVNSIVIRIHQVATNTVTGEVNDSVYGRYGQDADNKDQYFEYFGLYPKENFTKTFENLPMTDATGTIQYTYYVEEIGVYEMGDNGNAVAVNTKDQYTVSYLDEGGQLVEKPGIPGGAITIKNSKNKAVTSLTVQKKWLNMDGGEMTEIPYQYVKLAIYQVGSDKTDVAYPYLPDGSHEVVLNGSNGNWSFLFQNLPLSKKDPGGNTVTYKYYIQEVAVSMDGNEWKTLDAAGYTVSYTDGYDTNHATANATTPIVITNKKTVETTQVTVEKKWVVNEKPVDSPSDASATFQLYQKGTAAGGTETVKAYGDPVVLRNGGSWTHTWSALPKTGTVDDVDYTYTYYLLETGCTYGSGETQPKFTVTYAKGETDEVTLEALSIPSNGESEQIKACAADGEKVTVTNTSEQESLVLPQTGGPGTAHMYILGWLTAFLAGAVLIRRRKREARA